MVIGTGQVTNDTGNVVEPAYGLLKSETISRRWTEKIWKIKMIWWTR